MEIRLDQVLQQHRALREKSLDAGARRVPGVVHLATVRPTLNRFYTDSTKSVLVSGIWTQR